MELLEEIREKFSSTGKNKIRKLKALPEEAPGYVLREDYWYGVAIPYEGQEIEENFANARVRSAKIPVVGSYMQVLTLECGAEDIRHEFSTLCAEFLEPDKDCARRQALVEDPYAWWENWRELLGNTIREKKPYQILGELLVLERLLNSGKKAIWQGANGNTKDIATDDFDCEVKSTLNRYANQVSISSKFQLNRQGKPLKLAFVRFEPSKTGDSLKQALERLVSAGIDRDMLLRFLARQGVVPGNMAYTKAYNLLEIRMYDVDDKFPVITDSSFVEGHMPESIVHFTYTIDLTGISYQPLT